MPASNIKPFANPDRSNVRIFGIYADGSAKSLMMFLNSLNRTVLLVVDLIPLLMRNNGTRQ